MKTLRDAMRADIEELFEALSPREQQALNDYHSHRFRRSDTPVSCQYWEQLSSIHTDYQKGA